MKQSIKHCNHILLLLVFYLVATAAGGCNNENASVHKEDEQTSASPVAPSPAASPPTVIPAQPGPVQPAATTASETTAAAPVSPGAAEENGIAVNPEHGKSGHRCDVPVGAALTAAAVATGVNYCK